MTHIVVHNHLPRRRARDMISVGNGPMQDQPTLGRLSPSFPPQSKDAGRVTPNFGANRAKGEAAAKANAAISKEEWIRRGRAAKRAHAEAVAEGERRKDSRGAFPKDIIRKMSAAVKEMDLARQFGGYAGDTKDVPGSGPYTFEPKTKQEGWGKSAHASQRDKSR
jgi:hypothetical protein